MRILFDSKETIFKTPFGTLCQGQECQLHIHIPSTVNRHFIYRSCPKLRIKGGIDVSHVF